MVISVLMVVWVFAIYAIAFKALFISNEDWGLTEVIMYFCLVALLFFG